MSEERGGKEKETKSNGWNEELEHRKEERNVGRVSAKRKKGTGERDSGTGERKEDTRASCKRTEQSAGMDRIKGLGWGGWRVRWWWPVVGRRRAASFQSVLRRRNEGSAARRRARRRARRADEPVPFLVRVRSPSRASHFLLLFQLRGRAHSSLFSSSSSLPISPSLSLSDNHHQNITLSGLEISPYLRRFFVVRPSPLPFLSLFLSLSVSFYRCNRLFTFILISISVFRIFCSLLFLSLFSSLFRPSLYYSLALYSLLCPRSKTPFFRPLPWLRSSSFLTRSISYSWKICH